MLQAKGAYKSREAQLALLPSGLAHTLSGVGATLARQGSLPGSFLEHFHLLAEPRTHVPPARLGSTQLPEPLSRNPGHTSHCLPCSRTKSGGGF